jgi:hypothetical protein
VNQSDFTIYSVIAICLIVLGYNMRQQQKKDWKAFLFGGIAMLVVVVIAFIFHLLA